MKEENVKVPTVEEIIAAVGGKPSRDGKTVIVSYGSNGYARLTPDWIILHDETRKAARIEMAVRGRKGGLAADLRSRLRAAGLEVE